MPPFFISRAFEMADHLSTLSRPWCSLLDLLLPPVCPLCRMGPVASGTLLCSSCAQGITLLDSPCCPSCSLPYPAEVTPDHLCEECLRDPPAFERALAVGLFDGVLREAIHRFKFRGAIGLDRVLASLIHSQYISELQSFGAHLLVPVPLHSSRLKQRCYNQSLLLSRRLGKVLGIAVASRALRRTRETGEQQGLSGKERRANLRGAFEATRIVEGRRVVLLDDVMTTGATVRECSRVLKRAGAEQVFVVALARAALGRG